MDWETYEETVKTIYQQLGKNSGVEIICWGRNCTVTGKSSVSHQIDVLTKHNCGAHEYKTAIECKFWEKKVPKDDVAKLANIIEDSGIEKGVIVSKCGFTPDAITFAKYKNISLVELRKPIDDDWDGRIKDFQFNFGFLTPYLIDLKIIVDEADANNLIPSNGLQFDAIIHTTDGNNRSVGQVIDEVFNNQKDFGEGIYSDSVSFPNGSTLSQPNLIDCITIKEVKIKFERRLVTEKVELLGDEYISLIMLNIFEKRKYSVSIDGHIKEIE